MSYNPYGGPPYGPPPTYGSFPGSSGAPGMAPPPGLGPPPGMSSAPGLAPPPGVQQPSNATQANRPSGLPASFQPPPNLPNINFNAPVIRLGSTAPAPKPGTPAAPGRKDSDAPSNHHRPGVGAERGLEHTRAQLRESMQALVPPTNEERLRTIFIHKIPESIGGDEGMEKLLNTVGRLRRWDSAKSQLSDHKGELFGFAQYEDPESLGQAIELLKELELPLKKQAPKEAPADGEEEASLLEGVEKVQLQVTVDPNTTKYLESYKESRGDDSEADARMETSRDSLKQYVQALFFPRSKATQDGDGDTAMGEGTLGENVEVVNIPLAQDDELADIPAEMREVVAQEIAAFRERSNRRDMERLRREEELEEMERQRSGGQRPSRLDSPVTGGSNQIPLGPRNVPNAPSGPRGQGRGVEFVNGGSTNGHLTINRDDEDSEASDEELHRRDLAKQKADEDKLYVEAERKWVNRERQRGAALDRERERERAETESLGRRKEEQLDRERNWDDEREAARKHHLYYRDHGAWVRKRAADKAEEDARDEMDKRAEHEERRRAEAEMEQARGMADSFLEQQAQEMERRQAAPAAPQKVTISFAAAAQKAQAQRGPQRRTVAEVEGLLDDEEQDSTVKRQLVPIKFEPITDAKALSEEDIQKAVRALAQEIPTEKEGLWEWTVKWDYLEESVIREKLRPFVEKKVVEYLGVQEQFLVNVVEEHLRKHEKPGELVDTLAQALDEDAEDLVKKLWRMVIFFTECEKRGLPA